VNTNWNGNYNNGLGKTPRRLRRKNDGRGAKKRMFLLMGCDRIIHRTDRETRRKKQKVCDKMREKIMKPNT
jgi:hypothetical protein